MSISPLRRRAGALALLAAAALAPAAAAQTTQGLTLEEALRQARGQNPDRQAQRNDAEAAQYAVRQARADFLPSADASASFGYTAPGVQRFGSEVFGRKPEYYSSGWDVSLSYQLSRAKLLQPRIARAEAEATDRRIEGYEATLTSQVAQQYLTALQAAEQVAQGQREVDRTREHERLAQARFEVGTGTQLDIRRAQVERGRAEVALLQHQGTYGTEVLRLGQLMGTTLSPETPLTSRFELFEPTWSADELVRQALEGNPDLVAARATQGAARTRVRAARSAYLPTLSFRVGLSGYVYSAGSVDPLVQSQLQQMAGAFAGCQEQNQVYSALDLPTQDCALLNPDDPAVRAQVRRNAEASNPSFPFGYERQPLNAGMTISLPLFDGLQRERRMEEARVQAGDAELRVRAEELELSTGIRTGLLALQTAYHSARLQRQVAENAAEELRMARERYRLGSASSLEVTDAQTRLAEAERATIDAVYTFHKSLAALEALVGRRLR
ncbi:MAG TPA: TolC family protein [Longimicrobium sp.]|nr:TolC family protein [Longimicrobium sp.]